jgi:hypothetical protein
MFFNFSDSNIPVSLLRSTPALLAFHSEHFVDHNAGRNCQIRQAYLGSARSRTREFSEPWTVSIQVTAGKHANKRVISGSHVSEYEDDSFLGYSALQSR